MLRMLMLHIEICKYPSGKAFKRPNDFFLLAGSNYYRVTTFMSADDWVMGLQSSWFNGILLDNVATAFSLVPEVRRQPMRLFFHFSHIHMPTLYAIIFNCLHEITCFDEHWLIILWYAEFLPTRFFQRVLLRNQIYALHHPICTISRRSVGPIALLLFECIVSWRRSFEFVWFFFKQSKKAQSRLTQVWITIRTSRWLTDRLTD